MKKNFRRLYLSLILAIVVTSTIPNLSIQASDLPDELVLDEQVSGKEISYQNKRAYGRSNNAITCNYSLSVYNDYTYVWAYSYTENGYMDLIETTCEARFKSGAVAGTDRSSSRGGQVWADSAIVQVNKPVFNLQVYSATSTHHFYRNGYLEINKTKNWKR